MKCGFAKVNITPKIGAIMQGTYELKRATGILDELHARAVSFFDGEKKAIIVSVDLCNIATEVHNECRKRISEECNTKGN